VVSPASLCLRAPEIIVQALAHSPALETAVFFRAARRGAGTGAYIIALTRDGVIIVDQHAAHYATPRKSALKGIFPI
jgi:hypothetical protein